MVIITSGWKHGINCKIYIREKPQFHQFAKYPDVKVSQYTVIVIATVPPTINE